MSKFAPDELPLAVANLFRLNHYEVEGPVKINGAEIDLIATPLSDPFAAKIYIEVTVEYVNNAKYGKDLTKLVMVREAEPGARVLIVSQEGFTLDVRERAGQTRIQTLTFKELFSRFERFEPYIQHIVGADDAQVQETGSGEATSLRELARVYQRPTFVDAHGKHDALDWLDTWLAEEGANSWLIIVGEYGTGKTALTRMLQRRWLEQYTNNPAKPIPIRIELGAFTRQFDAQGLLHHFLDHNYLGHVPVDFLWSLIRSGRIVLLLDGYDEMAQYLSNRERRVCLQTLAALTSDGARGILTSRPNYFSATEELNLFDHLYRTIETRSQFLQAKTEELQLQEQQIDDLIEKSLLERHERSLQDLTPSQTEILVRSILGEGSESADAVIAILRRVFRSTEEGSTVSLSGKPVIISYLIEVAEGLKDKSDATLSEWEIYTLVLDQLGLRDLKQTDRVSVIERRVFLQELAVWLTGRGNTSISEDEFRDLVAKEFKNELRRYQSGRRETEIDSLFDDLRRSGTLTRMSKSDGFGWKFSHNSLREFLVAERMTDELLALRNTLADVTLLAETLITSTPISDAMRTFVASRTEQDVLALVQQLTRVWSERPSNPNIGNYLALIWESMNRTLRAGRAGWSAIREIAGDKPVADNIRLSRIDISTDTFPAILRESNFTSSELAELSFASADLRDSNFSDTLLEGVSFRNANLDNCRFNRALMADVDLSGTSFKKADFSGVDDSLTIVIDDDTTGAGKRTLEKERAVGYLAFNGAITDEVDSYSYWCNDPNFSIIDKISSKLLEGKNRQRHGLEQRGAAAQNPQFAKQFIRFLESNRYVGTPLGRENLVSITPHGRNVLGQLVSGQVLAKTVVGFLESQKT